MSDDYLKAIEALETVLQNDTDARKGDSNPYFLMETYERVLCAKALDALMDRWYRLNHLPKL